MKDKVFEPHDAYEKDLAEALKSGEMVSRPMDKKRMKAIQEAAQRKLEEIDAETKRQISLKIRESDLQTIKLKAKEVSIPYQNIIQALIHKYATGQIKLEI